MDDRFVPLRMGDKIIGTIKFDSDTGTITGELTDKSFAAFLTEGFQGSLYEVSFYGRPAGPPLEMQQKFSDWYKSEVKIGQWERDNTTIDKGKTDE